MVHAKARINIPVAIFRLKDCNETCTLADMNDDVSRLISEQLNVKFLPGG